MYGPATPQAPTWIAFITMNASTIAHSHDRLQNSRHPTRRSWNIVVPPPCAGGGSFTRARIGIAITHPAACTTIAQAGPAVATSTPAMIGPPIVTIERTNDSIAFACCRCSGVVSCGMSPCIAGSTKAVDAPLTAARIAINGTVAVPVNRSAAIVPIERMSTT